MLPLRSKVPNFCGGGDYFFQENIHPCISAHKSGLLRLWYMDEETKNKPEIMKTFRSIHSGPISVLKVVFKFTQGIIFLKVVNKL